MMGIQGMAFGGAKGRIEAEGDPWRGVWDEGNGERERWEISE